MLLIEPLHSLLEEKWHTFAKPMFWFNFIVYVIYLVIFTTVAFFRKEGEVCMPILILRISFQTTWISALFRCWILMDLNFLAQPPFSIEDTPSDHLHLTGQLISLIGAVYFFFKGVSEVNIIQQANHIPSCIGQGLFFVTLSRLTMIILSHWSPDIRLQQKATKTAENPNRRILWISVVSSKCPALEKQHWSEWWIIRDPLSF